MNESYNDFYIHIISIEGARPEKGLMIDYLNPKSSFTNIF